MHPMFIELFIETGADDLVAERDRRRRVRRSRRARPAVIVSPVARNRQRGRGRDRRRGSPGLVSERPG
jgi:hypothetical protein